LICTADFSRRPGASLGFGISARWNPLWLSPGMTVAGSDLYPTLAERAAGLCFSLVGNHAFVDGNKRVRHAAMETFLMLNGAEIDASLDEQERVMLELASGRLDRGQLAVWLRQHLRPLA
jgi:death-on-curing protein